MPDGSPGEMASLVRGLRLMASGKTAERVTRALAQEAVTQVRLGFKNGVDPSGNAWKALTSRPGGSPLRDKGRLANSFSAKATGTTFVVGTNVKYAATHQYGATIRPKAAKALSFKVQIARAMKPSRSRKIAKLGALQTKIAQGRSAVQFGSQAAANVTRRLKSASKGTKSQRVFAQHVTIPARPMLPTGELGPVWSQAFDRVAAQVAASTFTGT